MSPTHADLVALLNIAEMRLEASDRHPCPPSPERRAELVERIAELTALVAEAAGSDIRTLPLRTDTD